MVQAMYTATNDDRGTVQALARELEDAHGDGMFRHIIYIK